MSAEKTELSSAERFEIYKLEGLCKKYKESGDHSEELDQLKKLLELEPGDIGVLIALANCYFNLKMHDDWFEAVQAIREELLKKPSPLARDLIAEAVDCYEVGSRIVSMIFLWCACCIYLSDITSAMSIEGLIECLDKLTDVTWRATFRMEEDNEEFIGRFFSVYLFLLEDLELQIRNMSRVDEDSLNKVLMMCLSNKTRCLIIQGNVNEAMELSQNCVEEMEEQLDLQAEKSAVFCEFLGCVGVCYAETRKMADAIFFFERTLYAANQVRPASDGERDRREDIVCAVTQALDKCRKGGSPTRLSLIFG